MARRGAQLQWPARPTEVLVLALGRLGHDLQLDDRGRALAVGGADTVRPGVAATDHHHALAGGDDRLGMLVERRHPAVRLAQVIHCEVDTALLAPRNRQVARLFGAAGHHHHVIIVHDPLERHGHADFHAGAEDHALGLHLLDPAVDQPFLQLEVGDAIAQQPADPVGLFEHRRGMAHPRQLLGAGHAGRPRSDHGDALAGAARRDFGLDPALGPAAVDDRAFDRLDRHRRVFEIERARRFAWGRADAAGEFGEIVGRVEPLERFAPVIVADQFVPVGDQVGNRAAGVAERHPAIEAARGLAPHRRFGQRLDDIVPVGHPLGDRVVPPLLALDQQAFVGGGGAHAASSLAMSFKARR